MRVALVGRHSNRTPFAYPAYRDMLCRRHACQLVPQGTFADLLVVGFERDLREALEEVRGAYTRNPNIKIAVISEEPLWDSLWSPQYRTGHGAFSIDGDVVPLIRINHVTSHVFDFERLPYFITTTNDYFLRYQLLFKQRCREPVDVVLRRWTESGRRVAFIAEKRLGDKYQADHPEVEVHGLSDFRTRVAMALPDERVVRTGRGWSDDTPRQSLPDWHLDKLADLNGRFWAVSALENTHCPGYITEKLSDAFAVGAVPIYYASAGHGLERVVNSDSVINLYGQSPDQAQDTILRWPADKQTAEVYRATLSHLSLLFSDPRVLIEERLRVLDALLSLLERVVSRPGAQS